jgi:predicted transcriptional regulator
METRVVTSHLPVELMEKVDRMAEALERPKSWIVKQALLDWVEREELKDRLTREALAEVDQGLAVEHDAVLRWAASLGSDNPLPVPRA